MDVGGSSVSDDQFETVSATLVSDLREIDCNVEP
jgi:hypothetical protein